MKRSALQALAARWALAALGGLAGASASAQIAIDEINPIRSSLHATNANGGSGGRIQSVAADPQDGSVYYAASEWGDDDEALQRCRDDIAQGDIVIATMLTLAARQYRNSTGIQRLPAALLEHRGHYFAQDIQDRIGCDRSDSRDGLLQEIDALVDLPFAHHRGVSRWRMTTP